MTLMAPKTCPCKQSKTTIIATIGPPDHTWRVSFCYCCTASEEGDYFICQLWPAIFIQLSVYHSVEDKALKDVVDAHRLSKIFILQVEGTILETLEMQGYKTLLPWRW